MIYKLIYVLAVVGMSWCLVAGQQPRPGADVSEDCIFCMCHGSSSCNLTLGCTDAGLCGPLLISWPYWADAGKLVLPNDNPNSPGAYERCAQDTVCAGGTVRGYMNKYAQDCNGDGVINCDDYARLHVLGGFGCRGGVEHTRFYQRYLQCKNGVPS